jgi:hypothetical protein
MLSGLLRRDESLTDSGKERVVHPGPGGNMTPIVPPRIQYATKLDKSGDDKYLLLSQLRHVFERFFLSDS